MILFVDWVQIIIILIVCNFAIQLIRKAVSCKSNTGTGVFRPNCHEKLTLVNSLGMKFDDFSSLARISLLCGAALVHIHDS